MNDDSSIRARRPLYALVLSFGATGLGHIYCGNLTKGLVLFFIGFAFGPVLAAAAAHTTSVFALAAVLASILTVFAVFVYAAADAWRTARRTRPDYRLKEYNRWYIYLIFIVFAFTYPTSLAGAIRDNVMQAFKIPSDSMEPSILRGDYVLLNKARFKSERPQRGDVVIFVNPNDRRLDFMKRIVAMPGDVLEIRGNVLTVNGVALSSGEAKTTGQDGRADLTEKSPDGKSYRITAAAPDSGRADYQKTVVPNGTCFVLGDNRGHSVDSRDFGPVPLADVRGRVEYIYLPAGDFSRFGRFEPGAP